MLVVPPFLDVAQDVSDEESKVAEALNKRKLIPLSQLDVSN